MVLVDRVEFLDEVWGPGTGAASVPCRPLARNKHPTELDLGAVPTDPVMRRWAVAYRPGADQVGEVGSGHKNGLAADTRTDWPRVFSSVFSGGRWNLHQKG